VTIVNTSGSKKSCTINFIASSTYFSLLVGVSELVSNLFLHVAASFPAWCVSEQ